MRCLPRVIIFIALLALAACKSTPTAHMKSAIPETALPATLMLVNYPLSMSDRPTTAAASAMAHLEGRLSLPVSTPGQSIAHAGLLYQRYQITGRMADLDAAYASAKTLASAENAGDDAHLLWPTLAAYMHEFSEAKASLAKLSPAQDDAKAALLIQIKTARGQGRAPVFTTALANGAEFADLVQRAGHCVDMGDLDCATQNYHQAQFVYSDSAPFPLAWLHTQQGIALLRFGFSEWALRFFDAALARMPGYFLAAEHRAECLASTGQLVAARAEYLSIIAQTGGEQAGNPEFMAALAAVEGELENQPEMLRWQNLARQGFAARLVKYPNAYAQHAVDFYLQINDLARAERLALQNLQLRQDVGSYVLLAEVALAKPDAKQFCEAYQNAVKTGLMPPELMAMRAQALVCGGE